MISNTGISLHVNVRLIDVGDRHWLFMNLSA